jgi:putative sterol carrier protein
MAMTMAEFLEFLESHHRHEPMLERVTGTVRFEITDGEQIDRRLIRIVHGDIQVAVSDEPADCVITAPRAVCDDVVSGRTSALAAILRGAAAVDGDLELMVLAQRLFTASQAASRPGAVAAGRRSS